MKKCKNCGCEISDKVKYCPSCGKPQEGNSASKRNALGVKVAALIVGTCVVIAGGIVFLRGGRRGDKIQESPTLTEVKPETEYVLESEADQTQVQESIPELPDTTEAEKSVFTLITRYVDLKSYAKADIQEVTQSSVLGNNSDGSVNNAWMALDGKDSSCWQEGVTGSGIGETMEVYLNRKQQISYLTFRLGNWLDDMYYYGNNRPKTLSITLGDVTRQVTFPDARQEFVVLVDPAVSADMIQIQIDDVYRGDKWDDTCITDVGIYTAYDGLGWQQINGEWYYYEEKNIPKTGWLEQSGKKYFLMDNGVMKVGFLKVKQHQKKTDGGYTDAIGYFFLKDGSMYVGDVYIYSEIENGKNLEECQRYAQSLGGIYVNRKSDIGKIMDDTVISTLGEDAYAAKAYVKYRFYSDGKYNIMTDWSE